MSDEPKDDTDLELGVCTDEQQEAPRTMDQSVSMGMGRPLPPLPGNPEDYTVEFDADDPEHPYNWKRSNKYADPVNPSTVGHSQVTNTRKGS